MYLAVEFIKEVDRERLDRAIRGTSRWWTGRCNTDGSMVAIGKCMTDWARYACIYDVIIRPDWQRQGIGTLLMRAILRDLVEADVSMFHLWPTKGKVPFYEGLGFRAASQEQPVMTIKKDDVRAMVKAESRAKS